MKKGVFCLSLDTELLWGRHESPFESFIPRATKERKIITEILAFCKKNKFPITWAIVGHLFLDSCSKMNNIKHPEIVRSIKTHLGQDWFTADPCTSFKKDPNWYGSDIVKEIQKTPLQEVGLHAFSHVPFGNPSCSKATAESELAASLKVAQKYKITFASFVFPCNLINYLDLLKKYKFIAYRGIQPNIPILRGFFHHILMALDFFAPIASPVATASIVNGLVNIPASFYFPSSRGNKKYIPKAARFYKAKLGIDAAIKQRKIFHMWTHPTDLTDNSENLLKEFFAILNYALAKQKQGMLEIKTMKQIAQETLYES